jgi:hypothetical protein
VVAVERTREQQSAMSSSTPPWHVLIVVAALFGSPTAPAEAQEASLYAGAAHAEYADSLSGTAGTASLRLRSYRPLTAFDLQGSLSQFTTGEWAAHAGVSLTQFWRVSRVVAAGVSASGSYADYEGGPWSGFGAAGPMLAFSGRSFLLTVGASGGRTRAIDETTFGTIASAVRGRLVPIDGVTLDAGWFGTRARDTLSFADLTAGITWHPGALLLTVSGGLRMGDLSDDPWGQVRMELMLAPAIRVEAAAGRYPRDLTGFTDGLFLQGGLRVAFGAASPPRPLLPASPVGVTRVDDGSVRLTLQFAATPTELAIAGDFSAWTPVPLRRQPNGDWTVTLALDPGVHTYALIADGTWTLPDGVTGIDDDFGGTVGVLVVQPR